MKPMTVVATLLLLAAGCSAETSTQPVNSPPVKAETPPAEAGTKAALPSIVYYELSEVCPFCIKIRSHMDELEKEYDGKVAFSVLPCRSDEGVKASEANGWVEYIHGLEARDASGKVVGQIEGHGFSRDDLVAKVKLLVGDAVK